MLTLTILLSSIVMGAHVRLPFLLARSTGPAPQQQPLDARRWSLAAAPLLLSTGIVWLLVQSLSPNLGLTDLEGSTGGSALAGLPFEIKLTAMLFGSLLVTDLLVLFAWAKLDRNAWYLVAGLGLTALIGTSYAFNSIAFRIDPSTLTVLAQTQGDFYVETTNFATVPGGTLGTLARALLLSIASLSVAMVLDRLVLPRTDPQGLLRYLPLTASISLVAYFLFLPAIVRSTLVQQQDHLTGLSIALLLGIMPWLPRFLRWPSLLVSSALLAMLLTRIVQIAG